MEKTGAESIYPAAPLETVITQQQQQQQPLLSPPAPPTYDQASATPADTDTPAATYDPGAPHVVVITQPQTRPFGPHPIDMQCPFCHNYIRTKIRHKPTSRTHLLALLLCVLQLYCFVCLPYCLGSCMKTNHYCGMCGNYLGTYDKS